MPGFLTRCLNDWAAITAFVTNPDLPATNNEAERALRDAVIAQRRHPHRGGLGGLRRHSERVRLLPPPMCPPVALHRLPAGPTWWTDLVARARKGLPPPTIPVSA